LRRSIFCSTTYNLTAANSQAGTYEVTAKDRVGNKTTQTFNLVNDEVALSVVINVPSSAGLGIPVSWAGEDTLDFPDTNGVEATYTLNDAGL